MHSITAMKKLVAIALASFLVTGVIPPAHAQWNEAMERLYLYCMSKYAQLKGKLGCQCDVEQVFRGRFPLEIVEYCTRYYPER